MNKLEQFVKNSDRIPSIPSQMAHLLQTFGEPTTTTAEIEKLILPDAVLAARILRLANSAFYFRMVPVTKVKDALNRLGFKTTRSMVVTVWTQSMKTFVRDKRGLSLQRKLLNHGMACAVIAKELMLKVNHSAAEDAFLAGLLHDVGRLAFVCQFGMQYSDTVLTVADESSLDICAAEDTSIGFNHSVLGDYLMNVWHLPVLYREAALHHHDPEIQYEDNQMLASIVLADRLATDCGYNVALRAGRADRSSLLPHFRISDAEHFRDECIIKIQTLMEIMES